MKEKRLGVALVGLGKYSTNQVAPALLETKLCKLTGIVTGTESKKSLWAKKYIVPETNIYDYQNFDKIADNEDIDIVYITLPNNMHAEYTIKAAKAGKHVICEKPMALSVQDCKSMIQVCKEENVKLFIGYRLRFDPFHLELMRFGQEDVYGPIKKIESAHAFVLNDEHDIRTKKDLGGGPLWDLGIYPIQAARYTLGLEPVAVTAKYKEKTDNKLFKEVEEGIEFTLEFPGRIIAHCYTSFADEEDFFKAYTEKGEFQLQPAFAYSGLQGKSPDGAIIKNQVNQQAAQLDAFANSIINGSPNRATGEEGMQDVKIMLAVFEAANTEKRVEIN